MIVDVANKRDLGLPSIFVINMGNVQVLYLSNAWGTNDGRTGTTEENNESMGGTLKIK